MAKSFSSLAYMENAHEITMDNDREFVLHLQQGLLLALLEANILTAGQYHHAASILLRQGGHLQ